MELGVFSFVDEVHAAATEHLTDQRIRDDCTDRHWGRSSFPPHLRQNPRPGSTASQCEPSRSHIAAKTVRQGHHGTHYEAIVPAAPWLDKRESSDLRNHDSY